MQFIDWLQDDSHKFSLQKLKRFKIKNEGVSNVRNDGPIAVSALNMEGGDVLLEITVSVCVFSIIDFVFLIQRQMGKHEFHNGIRGLMGFLLPVFTLCVAFC